MIFQVAAPLPVNKLFDYLPPKDLQKIEPDNCIGRRVKISFGYRSLVGVIYRIVETSETPADKLKPVQSLLDEEPLLTPEMIRLGEWLSKRYSSSLGEALFALMPPGRGNPTSFKDPHIETHYHDHHLGKPEEIVYHTADQREAIKKLHDGVYSHQFHSYLLYGVAAAGKTEVYMATIKDVMSQGRTSLVLTPEIGLAVQTAETLKKRFGEENVLLWHSDATLKNRVENWWRMKRGEFMVVVGPRSAALCPLPNLGLVVVDEEHDSSFKEDRKPRFHVRDLAYERAKQTKSLCVFGSATPSLETMKMALDGKIELLELKERAIRASAPNVRIVDINQEKYKGPISISLQKIIENRLQAKEQTILFLNKRGFHRYLKCPKCDWIAKCPMCDITLVEHKKTGSGDKAVRNFVCHYCSHEYPMPKSCPECKQKKLFAGGLGTQRVTEEVKSRFPWANVIRWDRDAVGKRGEQRKLYEKFSKGNGDILVGTQLVAQGFNFPKVTLVGVIDADGPLNLPDFRAAEQTFQIVTQVAGRAGRAMVTGDVLIQTRHPDHYALQHALNMDYKGFAETELKFRDEFNYPPFTHLIQISTSSKKIKQAEGDIEGFINWMEQEDFNPPVGVLGPTKTKRAKKGATQFQVLLKVDKENFNQFQEKLNSYLSQKSRRLTVNVDPI